MTLAEKWKEYRREELSKIAFDGFKGKTVEEINNSQAAFYAGAEAATSIDVFAHPEKYGEIQAEIAAFKKDL